MAERTIVSWTPENLISIPLMTGLVFLVAVVLWQVAARALGGGGGAMGNAGGAGAY
jgi:hypothetical protein